MKRLLQKTEIKDKQKLHRYVTKVVGEELSRLSKPCYYPKLKKHFHEIPHLLGLTEQNIKDFVKVFYKGIPAANWMLHKNPYTNLLIFLQYYFLNENDKVGFMASFNMLVIMYHSNLIHKFIKFCQPELFKYAIDQLNFSHLYIREGSISGALFFLSKELSKKYEKDIKKGDPIGIAKLITETRTRISASLKSFTAAYYDASKKGSGYQTTFEPSSDESEFEGKDAGVDRNEQLATEIAKKITIYKMIDQDAIEVSRKITKINKILANAMAGSLANSKHTDNVALALLHFATETGGKTKIICSNEEHFKVVRKLMSVKVKTEKLYYKKIITRLVDIILKDIDMFDKYKKSTTQTQFMVNLFLGYYLALVMKELVCGRLKYSERFFKKYMRK